MNKDKKTLASLDIDAETYYSLRKIMEALKKPLNVGGLKEVGLVGLYDFDVVPEYFSAKKLDKLLTALEEEGIELSMSEQELESLHFSWNDNNDDRLHLGKVLIDHGALLMEDEEQQVLATPKQQKEVSRDRG